MHEFPDPEVSAEEADLDRQIADARERAKERGRRFQELVELDLGISSVARKRALLAIITEHERVFPLPPAGAEAPPSVGPSRQSPPGPAPSPPAVARAGAPQHDSGAAAVDVLEKESLALALLAQYPDWTNADIARKVGCHPRTLYKWEKFGKARAAMKTGKRRFSRGSRVEGKVEGEVEE